ncbi:hypothetical protein FN846DRAFT_887011 [Sphaerosporella brunnea]|uniref:Uncharacterized protein n=1 Tax=Sphaerosporella brunnea TaxID=1250544 RepID=A0A5J5F7Y2_9PEZI|nr:hypothetical protein FN846DRAFT_887011 [Sphaerosporella brunnea]
MDPHANAPPLATTDPNAAPPLEDPSDPIESSQMADTNKADNMEVDLQGASQWSALFVSAHLGRLNRVGWVLKGGAAFGSVVVGAGRSRAGPWWQQLVRGAAIQAR